ncbi:MAG: DUF2779 domain-containing protein [Cyclobacteriaceae bacterium]|nr:DUF2779 domain-containing protein [Cyclobacteriaceae bacterium]MCH8517191.1 DUF2779 domain-containing protein [Cyclobacteriaceae bacterium]
MKYLSKSDFKVAQECPTKLYYKKHHYLSNKDGNEYLNMLADGGFMIGHLATLLYPEGIEISEGRDRQKEAIQKTEELLASHENITLFEPAIYVNNQLIRIDILVKKGQHFQLIEVKSKSYRSDDLAQKSTDYWLSTSFKPYLEDVAFQKKVLQEKYPEAQVSAYLMMPDKSQVNEQENLIECFVLSKEEGQTKVEFIGSDADLDRLRQSNFMGLECVDEAVKMVAREVAINSKKYIRSILKDQKINIQIGAHCKSCEYRIEAPNSGFRACWKKLADPVPHILDIAQIGNINRQKKGIIDQLIQSGKTGLYKMDPFEIYNEKKAYYNDRPLLQLIADKELMYYDFIDDIQGIQYPLHFIDFETCTMAIPFHAGMHPFQNVIFQWSCHTLHQDGRIEHSEWLNAEDHFPNIEFAKSLKAQLGDIGTVLTWSSYENSQLKKIKESLEEAAGLETELKKWIDHLIYDKDSSNNRILDMHKLAIKHYFHPKMGGKTSIKVVLPAVMEATQSSKIVKWLKAEDLYEKKDGQITDPYKLLEAKIVGNTQHLEVSVRNGSDAMIAYREMLYGQSRNHPELKKAYYDALKKYCKLDTLAMMIIWEHWQEVIQDRSRLTDRPTLMQRLGMSNG